MESEYIYSMPMGYVHQLNSVDGRTYQSILPQPSVWQLGLIKELG